MLKLGTDFEQLLKELFKPTTLYNNSSGSNGTITLSDNVSNYEYIEIYYRNGDGYIDYKKIYSPNGKICGLNLSYYNTGIGHYQNWSGTVNISDTTITHTKDYYTSNSTTATAINYIYITRVLGYKA